MWLSENDDWASLAPSLTPFDAPFDAWPEACADGEVARTLEVDVVVEVVVVVLVELVVVVESGLLWVRGK